MRDAGAPTVKGLRHAVHTPVTNAGYRPGVVAAREPESRRTGRPRRSAPSAASTAIRAARSSPPRASSSPSAASPGTTMAEIARRCGLQQPSLYYYFRSKGELLDEIVGEANRAPLELVARSAPPAARPRCSSTGSIRSDVAALCALPYDLNEIHRLAARDPDAFARYWTEREQLVEELAGDRGRRRRARRAAHGRPAAHRAHA